MTSRPSSGTTRPGPAAACRARSSTSCTSARSPPAAPSTRAIERLDHLVELGVTHVELMPVNAFHGAWGWGYDGVGWYAVHEPYGGPDGLKRFVDAGHAPRAGRGARRRLQPPRAQRQLPDRASGPYFTDAARNDLGRPDQPRRPGLAARSARFIIDNALMWLRDYHSTGCAWTPCTRCRTARRRTCSTNSPHDVDALSAAGRAAADR